MINDIDYDKEGNIKTKSLSNRALEVEEILDELIDFKQFTGNELYEGADKKVTLLQEELKEIIALREKIDFSVVETLYGINHFRMDFIEFVTERNGAVSQLDLMYISSQEFKDNLSDKFNTVEIEGDTYFYDKEEEDETE